MRFTCLHKRENPELENKTVEFFSIELLLLIDSITSERSSVESLDVNYKISYLSIIF